MAHIYMTFDFGTDEEKAQQARHKLDGWKQAFRLDKKLLYKFERSGDGVVAEKEKEAEEKKEPEAAPAKKGAKGVKPAKSGKSAKSASARAKTEAEDKENAVASARSAAVKLHLRLAFSGHEKMTEERWLKRIPAEEPFREAAPLTVRPGDAEFAEVEGRFDVLE